ncbi:MAG: HPr family phosphocarrier protein [Clostridia bacterium]|nr:HPr family phosphocarrier protein [Clostridia bacterium]
MKKGFLSNKTGLHARPASLLVQLAQKFESDIKIYSNGAEGNAKSIMGIMAMGILGNSEIDICANGADAEAAEEAIKHFIDHIKD